MRNCSRTRRNVDDRLSPGVMPTTKPPVSLAIWSARLPTVGTASLEALRSSEAGCLLDAEASTTATVGVLRFATSSSVSASLMLLLS